MNKNIKWFISIIMILGVCACSKELKIEMPDFKVSALTATVKAGDTVIFNLGGNPDIITFYSGEFGNDYAYIDRDSIIDVKQLNLSFQNQVRGQGGMEPLCQDDQFHILVTNDLDLAGATKEDSVQRIKEAVWTDLTDRFNWSPLNCLSTNPYISSGVTNIVDFIEKNKTAYLAFRYTNRPNNNETGKSAIWRFQALNLTSVTESGNTTLITQGNAGWKPVYEGGVDMWGTNPKPFDISTTSYAVTMRGLRTTTETYQMWCLSNSFIITDTNVGRNPGAGIKSFTDVPLTSYSHIYKKAGTYEAVFIATNANKAGKKETIHRLQIVVEP